MIYKPEAVTDLDTGAIVAAEVLPGDQADTEGLSERVGAAVVMVHRLCGSEEKPAQVKSLTADKGYFAASEIEAVQEWGLRTVVADPQVNKRKKENYSPEQWQAIKRAHRSVKGAAGKALLRRRGMHLERSFEHILDEGGLRRATLRGRENLTKRYRFAAACFNLSLLLRKICGIGTPKQWASEGWAALLLLIFGHQADRFALPHFKQHWGEWFFYFLATNFRRLLFPSEPKITRFSTVC